MATQKNKALVHALEVEASKVAELEELRDPVTHEEVLDELRRTRDALADLQRRLETLPAGGLSKRT